MDNLSLTYFVDFVMKAGTPKVTVVKNFKERGEYDPQTDFYKAIRTSLMKVHKSGGGLQVLDDLLARVKDPKKRAAYSEIARGWRKYIGKKPVTWFVPPTAEWRSGSINVTVNPEIGIDIAGRRTVIKLYLKEPKLEKRRAEVIAHLMNQTLAPHLKAPATMAVVDVRRGKEIVPPVPVPGHDALLAGEAASFAAVYANL